MIKYDAFKGTRHEQNNQVQDKKCIVDNAI